MKGLMLAVSQPTSKQNGRVLNIELLHADEGGEVTFNPILLLMMTP